MLLTKVGLKNFMKHENLDVSLESGMNVIRGSNEAGKSSLLTGIAYNWFGSGALPQSVEDTVTWGAKKTSMKTKTDFTVGSYDYVCYRSASGAELHRGQNGLIDGSPLVTGHKEVSTAIADLFDLPSVATATKLQIASQNDVRGVISLGATAAAAFIEDLIDMKDVDSLIKDVSDQLVYSSDAKKQASTSADAAEEQLADTPKPVSTKKLENEVASLNKKINTFREETKTSQSAATEAEVALRTCAGEQKATTTQLQGLEAKISQFGAKLDIPTGGTTDEDVLAEAALLEQTNIYAFFTDDLLPFLKTKPEAEWEGSIASLELYVKGLEEKKLAIKDTIVDLTIEIAKANGGIITDTVCPTCKQSICDVDKVEAENKELQAALVILNGEVAPLEREVADCATLIKEAQSILAFQQKQSLWVAKRPSSYEEDKGVVPHSIVAPGKMEKPARVVTQGNFNALCAARDKQKAAENAYEENLAIHTGLKKEEESFAFKIKVLKETHIDLTAIKQAADAVHQDLVEKLNSAAAEHSQVSSTLTAIKQTNEMANITRKNLTDDIASWRARAEEIQGNYDLISALRTARLEISTLLWQKLLGVTETYFSLFRGKVSTLNMSKKGILVDGHLSAPSGSTLDILGLALRLAMSKLFANNGLCILDEPSSGCDDERTAAMTAGLISSGFDQVVMVTHKDVDEAAGNLILI